MTDVYYVRCGADLVLLEADANGVMHNVTMTVLRLYDRTAIGGEVATDTVGHYATPTLAQLQTWANRTRQPVRFRLPVSKETRADV